MQRLKYSRHEIVTKLSVVKSLCTITPIDDAILDRMLHCDFKDLEDAIQYYSALAAGAEIIITRNTKDFSTADIPVLTPSEFLGK